MTEWRPIATAPRDGTPVLLYLDPPVDTSAIIGDFGTAEICVVVGWPTTSYDNPRKMVWGCGFCEEGAADSYGVSSALEYAVTASHWMPLPAPPAR